MFCVPSFDEMTNLTPYFNHVIPAYAGIQTVSHSASQVEEVSETGSSMSCVVPIRGLSRTTDGAGDFDSFGRGTRKPLGGFP